MEVLRNKARELLDSGSVQVVIGYGQGSGDKVRAIFIRKPEEAENLIFNAECRQNLAVYLWKPEVKAFGKAAVVAGIPAMRAILQLAAENQFEEGDVVVLGVSTKGELLDLADFTAIEEYISSQDLDLEAEDKEQLDRMEKMTPGERWDFWLEEFSRCIKCYACRASCPLCYCTQCAIECNKPQWIHVASHELGNLEWHVVRAMHLAGRVVSCGDCGRACPVGIPIHLLSGMLGQEIFEHFGMRAGTGADHEYALSSFKPEDKENFIR